MITSIINYDMIVYYGSDHEYVNGYKTDGEENYIKYNKEYDSEAGEYREGIKYLIYDKRKLSSEESFRITVGSKLEIHFSYPVQNLKSFFDTSYDNSEIISVDLSYFDCSEVIDMSYMFFGCSKLQVLDMSNKNLKNINEKKLENMFKGPIGTEFIDGEIKYTTNLKYLNIRGFTPFVGFDLFSLFNLTVCQDQEKPILKGNIIKNDCCFFYEDSCKPNYIIMFT